MTKICGLCILTRKHGKKMVQVQRQDGKTLEFRVPILVGELLHKFPGAAGVGLSNNSHHQQLPLTYKLKLGNMYYLVPKSTPQDEDDDDLDEDQANSSSSSKTKRRIKMVITKQQLQQLIISRQIDVLTMVQDAADKQSPLNNYHPYWRPHLHSIPEAQGDDE